MGRSKSLPIGKTFSGEALPKDEGVFHASGQLVDAGLLNNYERDKKQLTFQDLFDANKRQVVPVEEIDLGIRLSPAEDALKVTLERLLFEGKSKNGLGNYKPTRADLCGTSLPAPRLHTSFQELAREHTGKKKPSGQDLIDVRQTLKSLRTKEHVISVTRADKNGKISKVLDYARLITSYVEGYGDLTGSEQFEKPLEIGAPLLKKGKLLLTFNPIFALDINTKYIPKPRDLNERTRIAADTTHPSEAIRRLRDHLLRQLTDRLTKNKGTHDIGREKLIYLLGLDKFQKEGRKKYVEKRLKEAFDACQHPELPLIQKVDKKQDLAGNPKYVFTLNLKFPRPVAEELLRQSEEEPEAGAA